MFWDVMLGIVTELYQLLEEHAGSILGVEQAVVCGRMCSVFFYFFVSCSFLNTSLLHLKVFVSLLSSPTPALQFLPMLCLHQHPQCPF